MPAEQEQYIEVFLSYAHEDRRLCDKLKEQLSILERQKLISTWYDGLLQAGQEWNNELRLRLSTAHIILLLVSPAYIASDYCYCREMAHAMKRHHAGEARVIPIILRPVHWQDTPFGILQALPTGGKPVRKWSNIDDAFYDIADNITRITKDFLRERLLTEAETLYKNQYYEEADKTWERLSRLGIKDANVFYRRGNYLFKKGMYEDALIAYQEAYTYNPTIADASFHQQKGDMFSFLHRNEEARTAYKEAIRLSQPEPDPRLYHCMGVVLERLAQEAFEEAKRRDQGASNE